MLSLQKIWRPVDLKEAWEIQSGLERQDYCFVAGGTWLRTQWEANLRTMSTNLISLENILGMSQIKEQVNNGTHEVLIGSLVTLSNCLKDPLLNEYLSPLVKACRGIAAPSIRNQATIGGNVYTIAGDTIPSLLIMNAELLWFNGECMETETVEKYLISLQANDLKRDKRILVGLKIAVEKQVSDSFSFFTKLGRRETFTASLVSVAGKGKMNGDGLFQDVTLAAGGGIYPLRLSETELELENRRSSIHLFQCIHKRVASEFPAVSDPFASADYKKTVAANLITSELYELEKRNNKGGSRDVVES